MCVSNLTRNPLLSQERRASELCRGAAGDRHCAAGAAATGGLCGGDQPPAGHLHHNRGKRAAFLGLVFVHPCVLRQSWYHCAPSGEGPRLLLLAIAHMHHTYVIVFRRQIVLLGVACGPGPSGQGDQYVDLALQPLPAFAVPSDNVIMTCAVGTRYAAGPAPELHTRNTCRGCWQMINFRPHHACC